MQLQAIKEYLDYTVDNSDDPQHILDDIKERAGAYLSKEQLDVIQHTYEYARDAHVGQMRLSWEPYIVHPLKSTEFLMHMKPDVATIQTCILHDVIEDTPITYDEIKKEFWEEVAKLCEWLVKVSKVKYRGEKRQIETLKKTFLAMAEDLRVIFVKLVDRIHNIQTLHFHPKEEKRNRIAEETLKIYVPIAKRLGLYHYQLYLENGCFSILEPAACTRVIKDMSKYYADRSYTTRWIKKISTILTKWGLTWFQVKGRAKSPYRVHQKLVNKYKTKDISKVLDIIAFRVMTDSVWSCYRALGMIHHEYTPMIHKIKDYISVPKSNDYRSLHTTILGLFWFPVEVQIRTQEMDDIAEYGVAAHFVYSDRHSSWESMSDSQSRWIMKLQDIVKTYQDLDDKDWFKQELNIELLNKTKFLYTPKGDVIEMPANGTVLDFAFRIHSDVWIKFKNALVNGIIKPIGFVPGTGDVVSINTFRAKEVASEYWLDFLNTPNARNKLQKYLKNNNKKSLLDVSKTRLNRKLKERKLPLLWEPWDKVSERYSQEEMEKTLLLALDKQTSYTTFLRDAYPAEWRRLHAPKSKTKEVEKDVSGAQTDIIVDIDKRLPYTICETCSPVVWDRIVARTWKTGIKVHKTSCKGIKTVPTSRLLEAHWRSANPTEYKITLVLILRNHQRNLVQLVSTFADLHIAMDNISITNQPELWASLVKIESAYWNPGKISFLVDVLKKRKADFTIKKVTIA